MGDPRKLSVDSVSKALQVQDRLAGLDGNAPRASPCPELLTKVVIQP
jgi:hypothetical protein